MSAQLVLCGDPAAGVGGEFELECARELRDNLPDGYVVATNVHLPRGGGKFYECDLVLSAPGLCDILEAKCVRPDVIVWEDMITSQTGFSVDRVFSKLDDKAKVMASRRKQSPFPSGSLHQSVGVRSQLVVPSDTRITFKAPTNSRSRPTMTLSDTIAKYKNIAGASSQFSNAVARQENLNGWLAYRDESCRGQRKTPQHLGRFIIRKHLRHPNGVFEYCALDEPPCQMEVLLREFPFDPTLPASELQKHLRAVAREARVLMKLRHPYIACVIGHFQTGSSWVQVSDWFEGERLEDSWSLVAESSALDKIGIFLKLLDALEFCHERGVFHRNVGAEAVCVAPDLSDVRLFAFDCALDLDGTLTTNAAASIRRNPRLIAPEDLHGGPATNPRLSDIFQTGVLLYRLLENGEWPFENTFEYATSGAGIRPFLTTDADRETRILREAAVRMLDLRPESRPDLLSKIKQELQNLLA